MSRSQHDTSSRGTFERLLIGGLIVFVVLGLVGLASATGWEETLAQIAKLSQAAVGFLLLPCAGISLPGNWAYTRRWAQARGTIWVGLP